MQTQKKILIAEDEEISRKLLSQIIGMKYQILTATDGDEVIDLLEHQTDEIQLIVLDLMMPGKNGFEVMQFMKERNLIEQIPVVVITSSNDVDDELRAYDCGAVELLHKPYVSKIILRRIANVLELHLRRQKMELELKQRTQELMQTQVYDSLTGLMNMRYFLEKTNQILEKAYEDGTYGDYAFVYSNVCNFKYYNAKYGVYAGDQVLKQLGNGIKQTYPEELTARFGNDHFVILVQKKDFLTLIQDIQEEFRECYRSEGMKLKIGVFFVKKKGETSATACDYAKIACDSIRNAKENICIYDEKLERRVQMSSYVIQHIDEAITNEYIEIYYQPVIRTINGAFCGMEALARWIDPEMGFLSPGDFIPALEENRMITKLDLYVLRKICEEINRAEKENLILVPVSFNLSRYDFLECDIFTEVETIIGEFGIARDMINIEITESTIMEDPEAFKKEIKRFREGGYQVWMDDFGSGYSSLNVLKDFQFDEIKLDMQFLSTLDQKSMTVISSIILMAKKLGIQTLAEGVETEEQLEFLRDIGCEKAQGFLFSRPSPLNQLLEFAQTTQMVVEKRGWRNYYDCIGKLNFITDRPLAIVEYDSNNFEYLYVNSLYKDVWKSLGVESMDIVYENSNSRHSPLSKKFRELQSILYVGEQAKEIVYSVRGHYVRLSARCLAQYKNRSIYQVEITNLTAKEIEEERQMLDEIFRVMYALYDSVYLLDLDKHSFETLMQGASNNIPVSESFHSKKVINPEEAAELFIHPNEWELYRKFTDITTLVQRLKEAEGGYITEFFRTRTKNGAFVWKAHTMLYIPDVNNVIYCSRRTNVEQPGLIARVAPEYVVESTGKMEDTYVKALRKTLMGSSNINLFWKDKDRKFVGANERFLQTYGFHNVSEIAGKTDEDMEWHIDNEPFQDIEWRVLKNGDVSKNQLGRCIIQGVAHDILASKEPIYDGDKIIGLLGFFVDLDNLKENFGDLNKLNVIDQVTGLLSVTGFINIISEYVEAWEVREENFVAIKIVMEEYHRATKSYGEKIAKQMIWEFGQTISETFGTIATCSRVYSGKFIVLMKCTEKEKVKNLVAEFKQKVNKIHTLAGYAATVRPVVKMEFADEVSDMGQIIGLAYRSLEEKE